MKNLGLLFGVFLTACAAAAPLPTIVPTSTLVPSPTPRPILFSDPRFVFQGNDPSIPIVTHNPSAEIKNLYINPGAVLFHDGKFHMFFNSFTQWPGVIKIGYMTSNDGYHWQMPQNAPVFTTDQIPYGDGQADVSSALVMEDGTWVMYFHTITGGDIGRVTAPSPLGPWSVDANPVLEPSPPGVWDYIQLEWPCVVKDGEKYGMYYGVKTKDGYAIGFATSTDGIKWSKYNDPETTDAQFTESDPVFTPEADWEHNIVNRPRVVKSPDGWVMIYQAGTSVETRGLAVSNDGIHWERYSGNPIFTKEVFPIPNAKTWDTNLLYQDDTYYYFMELGSLKSTNLYLTTHKGSLRQ